MSGSSRSGAACAAVVVVLVLTACGTGTGAQEGGAGAETGGSSATGPADGAAAAPTTDDASLVTVVPPQLTTLDTAAASATPSATVVVGDGLTYRVTGQVCDLPGVRADGYAVRAHGQFCLLQVSVTNTGAPAQRFTPDRALLLDGVDAVAPSEEALALLPLAAMDADVPPATTLSGSLVYDVPRGDTDRELRFDDGPSVRLSDVGAG